MRIRIAVVAVLALATAMAAALFFHSPGTISADQGGTPRYQHIVEIIEENHDRSQIVGNPNAPTFNALANQYGQAVNYFGVTHPSEPNYVAGIGGTYLGIQDDDAYNCQSNATIPPPPAGGPGCGSLYPTPPGYPVHTSAGPNLASQMDAAGLSWKGYFQALPAVGFTGTCAPATGSQCLYASKHNGFINFDSVRNNPADLNRLVPLDGPQGQLTADLQSGNVPAFSYIVPDQCHDEHGLGSCTSSAGASCDDACLVSTSDAYAKNIVDEIMHSPVWQRGNNAIVIVWDEGNTNLGTGTNPNGNPGGGNVMSVVVTNHGPKGGLQDATAYNHYSLLKTIENAFNLDCIANACDAQSMLPLFRN